jgi:hypothetical protein
MIQAWFCRATQGTEDGNLAGLESRTHTFPQAQGPTPTCDPKQLQSLLPPLDPLPSQELLWLVCNHGSSMPSGLSAWPRGNWGTTELGPTLETCRLA